MRGQWQCQCSRGERAPNVIIMVAGHFGTVSLCCQCLRFFFGADVVDAASFLLLRLTKRSEAPFACFFFARPNRFGFTCHCTAIIVGEHTSTSLLSSVCQKAMKMKEDDDEDDDDENYEHGAKRNETCTLH